LEDPWGAIVRVRSEFETEAISIDEVDGLGEWRFNLSISNTEQGVCLNVEARGDAELVTKRLERMKRAMLE